MDNFVTHDQFSESKKEFRDDLSELKIGQAGVQSQLKGIQQTLDRLVEHTDNQNGRIGTLEQASAAGRGGLRTACWFVGISLSLVGLGISAGWVLFRTLGLQLTTGG